MKQKSLKLVILEGLLYVTVAAGQPFVEYLISDRPLTHRSFWAVSLMALINAANTLKSYLSSSKIGDMTSEDKPIPVITKNDENNPTVTKEASKLDEPHL